MTNWVAQPSSSVFYSHGGVNNSVGIEPGNATPGQTGDSGEFTSYQNLAVSLDTQGVNPAARPRLELWNSPSKPRNVPPPKPLPTFEA